MLIAHVTFQVAAADRPAALAALLAEAPLVRVMPGNIAFQPFLDPTSDTGLGVQHEWADGEAFAGYAGSEAFARSGAVLRPMMIAAPVSKRFRAELLETIA